MIAMLTVMAALSGFDLTAERASPSVATIEVGCTGSTAKRSPSVLVDAAGIISKGVRQEVKRKVAQIGQGELRDLYLRLDAAGFDRLNSLAANRHVRDGTTCHITRTGARGSHSVVFPPGATAGGRLGPSYRAVRAILTEILELADPGAPIS